MRDKFDRVRDLSKLRLADVDALVEIRELKDSGIILPSKKDGMVEGAQDYAIIVDAGPLVDTEKYPVGTVILAVRGKGHSAFTHDKKQYMIFPTHSFSVTTTLDNFDTSDYAGKNLSKVK